MPVKDVLKVNRKTFINPRGWLGYDLLKEQTVFLYTTIRSLFATQPIAGQAETFEEAQTRLNLTDADIKSIGENYLLYAIFYAAFAVIILGFSIYFIYLGSFAAFVLGLALSIFLVAQAFRSHFWHFQIKYRKLGCTIQEWRNGKPNPT